jgi:hypothetical protein
MTEKVKAPLFLSLLLLALFAAPVSCYYDNEETQYGILQCDTTAISFSRDVLPIIQNNCVSCHQPGGQQSSSPMTNYAEVKEYTQGRLIANRVNGIGGIMPPSGKMTRCNIQFIEAWLNAGAPDN